MCHYCGCRQMPLIRDYVAEHERVTDLGGDAVRAIDQGDLDRAGRQVIAMAAELAAHWRGEEEGIFRVMQTDEAYAAYIAPLVREHRELAAFLADINLTGPSHQQQLRTALVDLHEHISREEDGLFPASLTALDGAAWDVAIAAWHQAHPGEQMEG